MLLTSLIALGATMASATNLFVSDYGGHVTTLQLTEKNGSYSLKKTSTNADCGESPSWLTIDANRGLLFCLNEYLPAVNVSGSLTGYTINPNGSLHTVQKTDTPNGPVSGIIYGEPAGERGIALAHYGGSAVSTWTLKGHGKFSANQKLHYNLTQPGAEPDRQDSPHPHEAITDPTGQYVLVPDLGADLVRIYSWDMETLKLKSLQPLQVVPGTGPRHAAFYTPSGLAGSTTYFYLVGELAADVTAYKVNYLDNNGGLKFEKINSQKTLQNSNSTRRNAPAEIHISPDNRFAVISNRNDSSFPLTLNNGTKIESDSLSTFKLSHDGTLNFQELSPAYGPYPRHYTMNAIGNLVAVGLQNSQEVVILPRCVEKGTIGKPLARIGFDAQVTSVMWNEERALGVLGG